VNVLLHYNVGPQLRATLDAEAVDGIRIAWTPERDDDALFRELPATEALLHVLEPITAAVMDAAPRLRLIQKLGVGVNTIDLDAAGARGIAVANLPGVNATAVAELTLGLLLAVLRRIPAFDREMRRGAGWPLAAAVPDQLGEVGGRTIGLVGYGDIARRFGTLVEAMGARVVHHRREPSAPGWLPLDELLAVADVVSVHLPLTEETRGLLGADRLDAMKPGAILLNTGRGAIVDEAALAEALRSGRLAGAGLDVFEEEPLDAGSPLLALDNVVVTPHVAWLTTETLARCVRLGVANCRRLRDGEPLQHRVI
jgi:phosphoglycerate dehydrogenase-like enzyme